MSIPNYINCKSKVITPCDYFLHGDCESTCGYAKDVLGEKGASKLRETIKIRKNLDQLMREDLRDY